MVSLPTIGAPRAPKPLRYGCQQQGGRDTIRALNSAAFRFTYMTAATLSFYRVQWLPAFLCFIPIWEKNICHEIPYSLSLCPRYVKENDIMSRCQNMSGSLMKINKQNHMRSQSNQLHLPPPHYPAHYPFL